MMVSIFAGYRPVDTLAIVRSLLSAHFFRIVSGICEDAHLGSVYSLVASLRGDDQVLLSPQIKFRFSAIRFVHEFRAKRCGFVFG